MNSLIAGDDSVSARYTRIFNFNENRISLKMDVLAQDKGFIPMGRIDITEIPTNNGRITCSCVLSELQTGNSQRVILRLKDSKQRQIECEKVYEFFRRVLGLCESQVVESQETAPDTDAELGEFTD